MNNILPEHLEIGKTIMQEIMLDNGAINRHEKEKYPAKHLKAISIAAGELFDQYPNLLTNENIEVLCSGEEDERDEIFNGYDGYFKLQTAIENYFNEL